MNAVDNAIYDRIPDSWWSDESFMALLRRAVNPPRFRYFRDILARLGRSPQGLSVLDVGCGGGLLSEEFAMLGCQVTGVDRSVPTLAAARAHAARGGLDIRYLEGDAARLPFDDEQFDVACCCDVLEHVDDVGRVVAEIARVLRPGGVFFFDTINRTWRSKLLAIKLAQDWWPTRVVPRNVHVWEKFVQPRELARHLSACGMPAAEFAGLSLSANPAAVLVAFLRLKLARGNFAALGSALQLAASDDLSVSYMGFAVAEERPCTY
jgi:2-polyprenyl-6-hydroxyphenyl methylase / 3-demethylubiquinone-9 3-methyltransferase